jgi:hypothetical protein
LQDDASTFTDFTPRDGMLRMILCEIRDPGCSVLDNALRKPTNAALGRLSLSGQSTCTLSFVMSWLARLGLAILNTAVAAIAGIKPKGTRHVAHTGLRGLARIARLALVILFTYLVWRARPRG